MKDLRSTFLTLLAMFIFVTALRAERPSYESRFGLIPIGGFVLFFDSKGTLSYQMLTLGDLPGNVRFLGEVEGRSCQYGLSIPIFNGGGQRTNISAARGNGGYERALANIQLKTPDLDGIFDVKVDLHRFSILGIYRRECTEVSARGFSLTAEE